MNNLTPLEFKNQRIITTKVLAEEFGTEEGNIQKNYSRNEKEYVGVSRLTEITESNYDYAKEIALAVINTLIKFEWIHLNKMQEYWGKMNVN